MFNRLAYRSFFVLWSMFALVACDSSSSGNGGVFSTNTTVLSGGLSNSPLLTGKIVTTRSVGNQLWGLQLPGSTLLQYPHLRFDEDERYHNVARFGIAPKGYDDVGFVLTVRSCLPENTDVNCVVLLDKNGERESAFVISYGTIHGARLSRDGNLIALVLTNYDNEKWLQIYTLAGELVDESRLPFEFFFSDIEWHPSGQIYLSGNGADRNIWVTYPNSSEFNSALTLSLPRALVGVVGKMSLSPDATKIVFELIHDAETSFGEATPIVLDLETLALKRLIVDAHQPEIKDVTVDEPVWSPDGNWILVEYGSDIGGVIVSNTPGVVPLQSSPLPFLFAVPADGVEVPLAPYNDDFPTTAVRILSDGAVSDSDFRVPGDDGFRGYRWVGGDNFWLR